jgi:hypothetical protein
MKTFATVCAWLTLVCCVQGCLFVTDDRPAVGTLTVESSIDGYVDPVDCEINRVDFLELVIYDVAGYPILETNSQCAAFGASIDLVDGVYGLDATLVDFSDRAATTTLRLDNLNVYGGQELIVPIDFPARSFL